MRGGPAWEYHQLLTQWLSPLWRPCLRVTEVTIDSHDQRRNDRRYVTKASFLASAEVFVILNY